MKTKLNLPVAEMFLAATSSALAGTVRYVDINNTNATPPYTNWATAATSFRTPLTLPLQAVKSLWPMACTGPGKGPTHGWGGGRTAWP